MTEDPILIGGRIEPLRIASPTPVVQRKDAHMIDSVVVIVT
ncbi:MAG: hypothetical protein OXC06_13405 [Acidimicrobiaceae bacterium]|nr:hypothetical protein [Acidimicrobiaceae bacterium]